MYFEEGSRRGILPDLVKAFQQFDWANFFRLKHSKKSFKKTLIHVHMSYSYNLKDTYNCDMYF